MLRISKIADYGAVIMNFLAKKPDELLSATEIARKVHVVLPTTSKILKKLVIANLVVSVRGAKGGYKLAHLPHEITLAAVISALEGQPALTECNAVTKKCAHDSVCAIRDNWRVVNKVIMRVLETLTLADMMHPLNLDGLITIPRGSRVNTSDNLRQMS